MLGKITKGMSHITEYIGMFLLVAMTLVVCYTVFTRYALNFTPAWGEECALLCMVWFGFLAIALGVRDDSHIGVTILDKYLSPALLRILNVFKFLCAMGFGGFMTFEGWKITKIGMLNKFPGMDISSAWLYGVVPLSGLVIIVYGAEKIYHIFANKGNAAGEES